jgi:hypothetical protein
MQKILSMLNRNYNNNRVNSPHSLIEIRWVYGFALIVMVVTTIPYLMGYSSQDDNWRFTGFVFGVEDGNNYIAKMLRGSEGDWLFRTPYSAYPQRGVLAYPFYILLGKLTAQPGQHTQLVAVYHLARLVFGILSIKAMYELMTFFIQDLFVRRFALFIATLGGGMGWLFILLGQQEILGSLPLEFYSPESFGFLILYGLPHLALARALLLWGIIYYLDPDNYIFNLFGKLKNLSGLPSGILWLIMGLLQPLTVVLAWVVLGAHVVLLGIKNYQEHRRGKVTDQLAFRVYLHRAVGAVIVSSPIVIYTLIAFNADEFHRTWTRQITAPAPHPVHYLLAYGFILPFVVMGGRKVYKKNHHTGSLLVAWAATFPVLAYAPYQLQRRLLESYWVVLIVLAFGFFDDQSRRKFKPLIWGSLLVLPSTMVLLVGGGLASNNPSSPLFRDSEEILVFQYLAQLEDDDPVVLSAYETGNALPAWAPVFVVIGHGPESVHLAELEPRVKAFYQNDTAEEDRLGLLTEFGVDYVIYGPEERELGIWNPGHANYLEEVLQVGEYELFLVKANLVN